MWLCFILGRLYNNRNNLLVRHSLSILGMHKYTFIFITIVCINVLSINMLVCGGVQDHKIRRTFRKRVHVCIGASSRKKSFKWDGMK